MFWLPVPLSGERQSIKTSSELKKRDYLIYQRRIKIEFKECSPTRIVGDSVLDTIRMLSILSKAQIQTPTMPTKKGGSKNRYKLGWKRVIVVCLRRIHSIPYPMKILRQAILFSSLWLFQVFSFPVLNSYGLKKLVVFGDSLSDNGMCLRFVPLPSVLRAVIIKIR